MSRAETATDAMTVRLQAMGRVAVAVSGGVDSMTLSVLAHRVLGSDARMYHAVSPAVPPDATERVRCYAAREGWRLKAIDAGEFRDARYLNNPVDRCFHCKTNLYGVIVRETDAIVVSGTNLDDLSDYRPGLMAADIHGVRHPYVEAGIDKPGVRHLARSLGLDDLAELPAAPCLSSRVETGISIEADTLTAIYAVERIVRRELAPRTVRCRVRSAAIVIELDTHTLNGLSANRRHGLTQRIVGVFQSIGVSHPVEFCAYRMGSAFLRSATNV